MVFFSVVVAALLLDGVASLSLGPAAAVRASRRSFFAGGAAFAYSAAAIGDTASEEVAVAEVPSANDEKKRRPAWARHVQKGGR